MNRAARDAKQPGPTEPPRPAGLCEAPCLFCGVHDEKLRFREGFWRVVECRRCGLVYVNPRLPPDARHEMYQEGYWTSDRPRDFGYAEYLADRPHITRTYRRRASTLERYLPGPAHVLDVGCAAGFFLAVMAEKGWNTTGLEIAGPMVRYAQDTLGLPDVRQGDLLTADLGNGRFDVVTLWDVIEHLEDPVAHLQRVHGMLETGGFLVLETQNVAALFARLLGRKWQHYKHAEHLYHFDPDSLGQLLQRTGFEVLENTPRHAGKFVSMRFVAERLGRLHPWLSVLASPIRLLGRTAIYVNLLDEMFVVAVKR